MIFNEVEINNVREVSSKNKRVMVATMPLHDNHGGILQCYALCSMLIKLGYEPVVLNRAIYYPFWKKCIVFFLSRIPGQNFKNFRYRYLRARAQSSFVENYIPATRPLLSKSEVYSFYELFDPAAVISGSDQVWRFSYINEPFWHFYFLSFAGESKKIAYAASFGLDYWEAPGLIGQVRKYLAGFSAISVRESSGAAICKKTFKVDSSLVLDPTLLLPGDFYVKEFGVADQEALGLVTYILDPDAAKKRCVDDALLFYGFDCEISLNDPLLNKNMDAKKWVSSIALASLVLTDSFHGMVFSIIMRKNFVAFVNEGRGSDRFFSLCKLLGIEGKVIIDKEKFSDALKVEIDYVDVEKRLEKLKSNSIDYLMKALSQ